MGDGNYYFKKKYMKTRVVRQSIFTLLTLSLLISCGMNQDKSVFEGNDTSKEKYLGLRKDFEYVIYIPDSLRTPEQNGLLLLLSKTIADNMVIENKRFVFKLSREDIVDLGFPEPYYELMLNNVTDFNIMLDNADSLTSKHYYQNLEKEIEEFKMQIDSMEADWIKSGKAIKYGK